MIGAPKMEFDGRFIMQKKVDWSLLNHGFAIPVSVWNLFQVWDPSILIHGASRDIKIIIGEKLFDAKLINQNFDQNKFPGHKDLIQIRYNTGSSLAKELRRFFSKSYDYIYNRRAQNHNPRVPVSLPSDINEFFRLFFTKDPNVFYLECNSDEEYKLLSGSLQRIGEDVYESINDDAFFMQDASASLEEKERIVKCRKIDRNIINILKKFYNYCDQISGEKIGSEYGESVVEAHHIDYFINSLNNNSTNIIIISPNYHRIIHKNNPIFNRKKFQFEFLNGEILKLKLFDHLKIS